MPEERDVRGGREIKSRWREWLVWTWGAIGEERGLWAFGSSEDDNDKMVAVRNDINYDVVNGRTISLQSVTHNTRR